MITTTDTERHNPQCLLGFAAYRNTESPALPSDPLSQVFGAALLQTYCTAVAPAYCKSLRSTRSLSRRRDKPALNSEHPPSWGRFMQPQCGNRESLLLLALTLRDRFADMARLT